DGWYECTGKKGDKQPWFISAKDEHPILMAGITAWEPGKEVLAETGFAIITDDAAGGMVDIHDRRPVCLTPDDAQNWIDTEISVGAALELLSTPRPESAFQWWPVTRAVGNSRYQLQDAAAPIAATLHHQSHPRPTESHNIFERRYWRSTSVQAVMAAIPLAAAWRLSPSRRQHATHQTSLHGPRCGTGRSGAGRAPRC